MSLFLPGKLGALAAILTAALLAHGQAATADADAVASETATSITLSQALTGLQAGSFQDKEDVIAQLLTLGDERVLPILKALLSGDLSSRENDSQIYMLTESDGTIAATDALTGAVTAGVDKTSYKKITINNKLRGKLRSAIAQLSLAHPDTAVRISAVQELLDHIDPDLVTLLQERRALELDKKVVAFIDIGIAMARINADDKQQRLQSITILSDSNHPEGKRRIIALLEKDPAGKFLETDPEILRAAQQALKDIEARTKLYGFAETVFFGLSLGSVLLLAAIGLAITFGVMGVINMAHGELMMLGAYTTYVVQLLMPNHIDLSLFVAIPAAFLVTGAIGIAIERGVIRLLYGRPLETLLATFGISLILQQLVRSVFSPLNRSVETPSWMSGSWEINSLISITYNRLYILLFALAVFAALVLILKKTRLGLQVRAVSQNRAMARAMGVRSDWVDALTFGLGSGIAGIAGVALSQLTNVGPNLGQDYIIDSFMVVVFGGVGNLWGTLVGAMSLGVINKFMEPWSGAVLAKIIVLAFIILFIQKRPRGLFPQKGRAVEN